MIRRKIYYQMIFTQKSPLRIGNGHHEESDSDLMLDSRNMPFIPGTSIAGLFRHRAVEQGMDCETEKHLFGIVESVQDGKQEALAKSSAILFSDAVLPMDTKESEILLGQRDGVGLGEWSTALKGSKFDFQIAETERRFVEIIEWSGSEELYKEEIEKIIEPIIKGYVADGIKAGARTTRGYGEFSVDTRRRDFIFPQDIEKWLDFNPFSENAFTESQKVGADLSGADNIVEVSFRFVSPFSIRVKTARNEIMEDGSVPDTIPMENIRNNPVIPGTAWAGMFRHHMHDLLRDTGIMEESDEMKDLDGLFGLSEKQGKNSKSRISFSESEILESRKKSVMRTAIDRFTGSPRTAALFTSIVCTGGHGRLCIRFREIQEKYLKLLKACIYDLHLGLISVGGEASVGRGIVKLTGLKCNGKDMGGAFDPDVEGKYSLDDILKETKNAKEMGCMW